MADLDVERNRKGNNDKNRDNNSNRENTYKDNSRKWWIGAIIAVVLVIILLLVLNDRTDYSMDDEPATEPTAMVVKTEKLGPGFISIAEISEEIEFL